MHLTRRKHSQFWQLELKFPTEFEFPVADGLRFNFRKHFTKSLGTSDRAKAEILAAEYVHWFRVLVYEWKTRQSGRDPVQFWKGLKYEDGLQEVEGKQAVVSGSLIQFFGADGKPDFVRPNPLNYDASSPFIEDADTARSMLALVPDIKLPVKFMPKPRNASDDIIEGYITNKRIKPRNADEVWASWTTYKDVIGTPLAKASRKEGRALVTHLFSKGYAYATVQKKVGWLAAACAYAIDEGHTLTVNPFARVMPPPQHGDAEKRHALTESDMAKCWAGLGRLIPSDQLLWKLLAKTGMRLGEAMSIRRVEIERGSGQCYVSVGTKTHSSVRFVPVPRGIGFPDVVEEPLFVGTDSAASKRLNRHIKACIEDAEERNIVVHGLRHRMVDLFKVGLLKAPNGFVPRRLLGHAAKDVHEGYGEQPPMSLLAPLVEANKIDGTMGIVGSAWCSGPSTSPE